MFFAQIKQAERACSGEELDEVLGKELSPLLSPVHVTEEQMLLWN